MRGEVRAGRAGEWDGVAQGDAAVDVEGCCGAASIGVAAVGGRALGCGHGRAAGCGEAGEELTNPAAARPGVGAAVPTRPAPPGKPAAAGKSPRRRRSMDSAEAMRLSKCF
mmetsp:Transcript_39953/g.80023  ORF Transcript_39953/g.80023 Transcript_39953/m.80023 type:complete len:111 (+) Transcript_39953:489-821(+)